MGMFDSIIINPEKLPVTREEKILLKDAVFQTKDFDKLLLLYLISDNDELLISKQKEENSNKPNFYIEEEMRIKPTDIFFDKTAYHGHLNFYTSISSIWYEFEAKFTDDKLISIKRIIR